jgi:protein-glutamine gamma-glutamyltransferase
VSVLAPDRSRRIELLCFAALACVAALRWAQLVADPPSGRVTFAVLLATACGAALAAIAGLPIRRKGARWLLAGALTACALLLGLVLVGLPARLLLPVNWGELTANLDRSLDGLADVPVPYTGADQWTRLVIVLVAPLVVGIAALAAFWPTRRRAAGRISALVLLVGLYLVAVAWARPDRQLASGALLLVLVCAWLWLPGLQSGSRGTATLAVALAGLVAIPAAALVDPGRALIDYRHWGLFSANGLSFRWDQSYGPLDWPQRGTLLLEVASERSHYWKATNLDSFDGVRWERSAIPSAEPALGQPRKFHPKTLAPRPDPEWVDRINFRVRRLTSDFALGAGTVLAVNRVEARPTPDGVWEMTEELGPGDTYTALVYDPKPSQTAMRAAGTAYPAAARRYVTFSLPGRSQPVVPGFWSGSAPRPLQGRLEDTPYGGMYELARGITADAATPYDAVLRIERFLRASYDYRQDVPEREYPLASFLDQDRAGYCQQFSGTMALMLRMLGIPSRVAAGFATGGRSSENTNFLVDDTDAHNWVEVFFPGIGWVTFEPTPGTAPAETQLDDNTLGVTEPSVPGDEGRPFNLPDPRGSEASEPKPAPAQTAATFHEPGESNLPAIAGVVAGALALASVLLYSGRRLRTRRLDPGDLADAELRELDRALARLGHRLPPGSTLLRAERQLAELAGPSAAAYAAALRERRYRRPGLRPPTLSERRSLRRVLLRAVGPRAAFRVLRAIPPGGPVIPRRARGDRPTSRWGRRLRPPSDGAVAASAAAR